MEFMTFKHVLGDNEVKEDTGGSDFLGKHRNLCFYRLKQCRVSAAIWLL